MSNYEINNNIMSIDSITEQINNMEIGNINNFEIINEKVKNIILIYDTENIGYIKNICIIYNNIKVFLNIIDEYYCYSWIEECNNEFSYLIGKQIKSIQEKCKYNNIINNNIIYKYLNIYIYEINFYDTNAVFNFILKTTSNGYNESDITVIFDSY